MDEKNELTERVQAHVRNLAALLEGDHTLEELQAEAAALNDLLYAFTVKNELEAKLGGSEIDDEQRKSLEASLRMIRGDSPEGESMGVDALQKANELIKSAVALITQAQREVNEKAHMFAGYDWKPCGLCKGEADSSSEACRACGGKRSVLVKQPAAMCSRCDGRGVTEGRGFARQLLIICVKCKGGGWVTASE